MKHIDMDKLKRIVAVVCVVFLAGIAGATPLRVLILTGRNNHDWRATTASLKKTYEDSGRFEVAVTEKPSEINAAAIAGYDVLVSNWTIPGDPGHLWGEAAEKAIEDFVAGGKGLVAFHAGSSCFYAWAGFHAMVGGTWGNGTGHGHYHEFQVDVVDRNHPITSGLQNFIQQDELWHKIAVLQPSPGRKVLCRALSSKEKGGTGEMEDVAICTQYGNGRGFYTTLGHDTRAMETAGFKQLLLRGTEWAATGNVAAAPPAMPPEDLQALATYQYGQSRKVLMPVEALVRQAGTDEGSRKELAAQMAKMLLSDASVDCRNFLCVQLSLIGSAAEVPVLAGLLEDKDLGLAARFALERIACDEALDAMRGALKEASGELAAGLMTSLGNRDDRAAVEVIAGHLESKDEPVAAAAVNALGKIGGMEAMQHLLEADAKAGPKRRLITSEALLECAAELVADGRIDETAEVYRRLSDSARPAHIRLAAFPGLVAARKGEATPALLQALTGHDPAMRSAAINCLTDFKGEELATAVADKLDTFPPAAQVQVVSALATRGDRTALPGMTRLLTATNDSVRLAVIAALGQLGDASTVQVLAARFVNASERDATRESLRRLNDAGVDDAMVSLLKAGDATVRGEMAAALGVRGASPAVPALLEATRDADAGVRAEALKALCALADAKAAPSLMALLSETASGSDRIGIERALLAICRRDNGAIVQVLSGFDSGSLPTKISLLGLAGTLGGDDALRVVRAAAKDADPTLRTGAVRAMSTWPDAAPLEDLLAIALTEEEIIPKTLALRGFTNLAPKSERHSAKQKAALYAQALKTADRVADRKALLGGLRKMDSPEAMQVSLSFLDHAEVENEAGLAVVQIAEQLLTSHPNDVLSAMRKVRRICREQAVFEKATEILLKFDKPLNLALGATACSPDDLDKDGAASGDQAAIDGDSDTYWDEVDDASLYRLKIDFKQPTAVNVIRIEGFSPDGFAPKDFDIVCDDTIVKTVRNAVYDQGKCTVPFPTLTCQSLELRITGRYGPSPAIRELEIFCVVNNS